MSKTLALVSCVSQKASIALPARKLYISDWFTKAAAFAEKNADEWYILSAKYGLVTPNQILEPYNLTLKTMGVEARRIWSRAVFSGLQSKLSSGDTVIFLAGQTYRQFLAEQISRIGCTIQYPLEGLRIGEQLQWLKLHLSK